MNRLKQGHNLAPLLFNYSLEYQENTGNYIGTECEWHQSDIGLRGKFRFISDIRMTEKNADVLFNACKDVSLAVNLGQIKYMEVGYHQGMMENEHFTVGSISNKEVKPFNI